MEWKVTYNESTIVRRAKLLYLIPLALLLLIPVSLAYGIKHSYRDVVSIWKG